MSVFEKVERRSEPRMCCRVESLTMKFEAKVEAVSLRQSRQWHMNCDGGVRWSLGERRGWTDDVDEVFTVDGEGELDGAAVACCCCGGHGWWC